MFGPVKGQEMPRRAGCVGTDVAVGIAPQRDGDALIDCAITVVVEVVTQLRGCRIDLCITVVAVLLARVAIAVRIDGRSFRAVVVITGRVVVVRGRVVVITECVVVISGCVVVVGDL